MKFFMQNQSFLTIVPWEFYFVGSKENCDLLFYFTSVLDAFIPEFHFHFVIYSILHKFNHCICRCLNVCWLKLTEQNKSNNRDEIHWWFQKLQLIRLESNLPERWKEMWVQTQTYVFWQLSTRTILNKIHIRFIIHFFLKTVDISIR